MNRFIEIRRLFILVRRRVPSSGAGGMPSNQRGGAASIALKVLIGPMRRLAEAETVVKDLIRMTGASDHSRRIALIVTDQTARQEPRTTSETGSRMQRGGDCVP